MRSIPILVADDHPMLLKGLLQEFEERGYKNLIPAINGAEALELILNEKPSIAILDVEMPILTGFEVIKKATELSITTKFIVLTSHKEKGIIIKAKELNISGYLLKDEPFSEIENCIKAVCKGDVYYSNSFDSVFNSDIAPELEKLKLLSPSERTIIRLVALENSSKEISENLCISQRTVEKHRTNIINKLNIKKGVDALSSWTKENKELILSV